MRQATQIYSYQKSKIFEKMTNVKQGKCLFSKYNWFNKLESKQDNGNLRPYLTFCFKAHTSTTVWRGELSYQL